MASYYKIIGGIKYDRSLLEFAKTMTTGRGDGRISVEDAKKIFTRVSDGYRITPIETQTIEYLQEEYIWTDAARTVWKELMAKRKKQVQTVNAQITWVIRTAFGLAKMQWVVQEKDVKEQSKFINNKLPFKNALGEALRCFLLDETDYESPRSIIKEVHGLLDNDTTTQAKLLQQTMSYLNEGTIYLIPWFSEELTDDERDQLAFYPPEWGERADRNWLFGLTLPTLSDHLFWAIVDREAKEASYCYGFN